jgi:hypothetical protein
VAHPSEDPIDPKAVAWMKPKKERASSLATMAAPLQRLSRRLGRSPEELARRIPPDTLRRLKYPVLEEPQPDGSTIFKHDLGIEEGLLDTERRRLN